MTTPPESVNVSQIIRTVREDLRTNIPNARTIHDLRLRDALVIYAKSTR